MKSRLAVGIFIALIGLQQSIRSFDGYGPPPEPEPAPAPPLTKETITTVLPDGTIQIAPASYFTPKIVYTGETVATGFRKLKQTTGNKYDTKFPTKLFARSGGAGLVYQKVHHPRASSLGLAANFDAFLNQITSQPQFLSFFQKLKVFVLHDIYIHLMKVYTNFNMQHPKELAEYISQEETYGLNKKTLVINHLVNVIEAQTNGLMLQMFPALQKATASWTGNFLMQHDTSDLNMLILDEEKNFYLSAEDKQLIGQSKQSFFTMLNQYFQFFNQYSALLDNQDPTTGMNAMVAAARRIAKEIENFTAPLRNAVAQAHGRKVRKTIKINAKDQKTPVDKSFEFNAKAQAVRDAKNNGTYLNPGIFFYDAETFRGIKLIPDLAIRIGAGKYQKVDWPSQIVADATKGTEAQYDVSAIIGVHQAKGQGYPIAYFKDANGNPTTAQTGATGLFVNMPNGTTSYTKYPPGQQPQRQQMTSLHEQELLKEPGWLGTQEGILKLLKACLGDFSQILGMGILNPCNEAIILRAMNPDISTDAIPGWQACQDYLNTIESTRKEYASRNPPES